MGSGINSVTLVGRLGQEPEIRYSAAGAAILNLRMATTESVKSGDEWQERTEWHSVVVFGRVAESLGRMLHKGSQVAVQGRLQTRSWEGKDGGKRYSTEIVAYNVVLCGGRPGGRSESSGSSDAGDYSDDDIPF